MASASTAVRQSREISYSVSVAPLWYSYTGLVSNCMTHSRPRTMVPLSRRDRLCLVPRALLR